jgi:hypothetical protein
MHRLWDNVKKYSGAREAADDNTAHAHCILGKQGYTPARTSTDQRALETSHTQAQREKCNTYCFPRQQ